MGQNDLFFMVVPLKVTKIRDFLKLSLISMTIKDLVLRFK